MSTSPTLSTADLRSHSTENHRGDLDKRRKWAHGKAFGPGRNADDELHARPAKIRSSEGQGMRRDGIPIATAKARSRTGRRQVINEYDCYGSPDSSAPEDIDEASAAPEPDTGVAYSFDADRGPSHGSQILERALAKAVERYEVVATDKLIKSEYEVLDNLDDEGEPIKKSKGKQKATESVDEDGFELL